MDDFSEIEKAIRGTSLLVTVKESNDNGTADPSSTKTARSLQDIVNTLMSDSIELKGRLSTIEAKVASMDAGFISPREKISVTLPNESTVGDSLSEQVVSTRTPRLRTMDLKDQMIADQQEQQERTHEAVDDVEAYIEGQNCPSCKSAVTKWCFIEGCFDWCFAHSAICTGEKGQVTGYLKSRVRDENGNSTIRETTFPVDLCNSADAGADCDIFNCEYSRAEWQEEEFTEWMAGQSP